MVRTGNLAKMVVQHTHPIQYQLPLGDYLLPLNPLIGKTLTLSYEGQINCIACGKETKKSFQQGYCYMCSRKLARCDFCILKPVLCHYHKGTCREPKWGEDNCMIPHVVYLANTSGLKIGITRKSQIPTRWIDQGAIQALPIFEVQTRRISGILESEISQTLSDRTNWRNMLKNVIEDIDLISHKEKLLTTTKGFVKQTQKAFGETSVRVIEDDTLFDFEYPVEQYPSKVKSHSFDKTEQVEGTLVGIKGQYLIFDTGVINIRKFTGYRVSCSYNR